jgi:hypothetical protein
VFTGKLHKLEDLMDSTYIFKPIPAQVGSYSSMVEPSYGSVVTPLPPHHVDGIPDPKKAGLGPENCSSCHY